MKRAIMWTVLLNCAGWLALSQSSEPAPRFEIADVQPGGRVNVEGMTLRFLITRAFSTIG